MPLTSYLIIPYYYLDINYQQYYLSLNNQNSNHNQDQDRDSNETE
jgi:hypothetical protein